MAYGKDNRTEFTFYETFGYPEKNYLEEVLIHVPFDIFMEVLHEFCYTNYDVNIDGTDNSVWNLFAGTNFFDNLFDDEDFMEAIKKAYENSVYKDDDYEEWASLEPWAEYDDSPKTVLEPGLYIED